MIVREYRVSDTQAIMKLFDDTVHETNIQDYTQEQVNAWTPENMDYSVALVYSCIVDNESRNLTSTLNIKCQMLSLIDYFNRTFAKPFVWKFLG